MTTIMADIKRLVALRSLCLRGRNKRIGIVVAVGLTRVGFQVVEHLSVLRHSHHSNQRNEQGYE